MIVAMRYMKQIVVMMTALSLSGAVAAALLLCDDPIGVSDSLRWLRKDKEDESRLSAIPILLYHNIDGKGPFSIARNVIEEHFRLIRERGVQVITVHEMLSRLGRQTRYDAPSLVITFDDGYPAMYTKLLPLARRYGYPMTLFVYINAVATALIYTNSVMGYPYLLAKGRSLVYIAGYPSSKVMTRDGASYRVCRPRRLSIS